MGYADPLSMISGSTATANTVYNSSTTPAYTIGPGYSSGTRGPTGSTPVYSTNCGAVGGSLQNWANTIYTNSAFNTWNQSTVGGITQSGKLDLKGKDADIVINGVSIVTMLQDIQERVNIMVPNKELEEKWESLAELGRQYKELEKKLLERESLINILESD